MSDTKVNKNTVECPECFGSKAIWNGSNYITCPLCKGEGTLPDTFDTRNEEYIVPDDTIVDDY